MDRDGHLDIVTPNFGGGDLTLLLGDGRAGFRRAPSYDTDERGFGVRLGDLDGDGKLDLVTATGGDSATVLLGDAQGRFRPSPGSPYEMGRGVFRVAVADLNGDGQLDIATANSGSNDVTVLIRRPSG